MSVCVECNNRFPSKDAIVFSELTLSRKFCSVNCLEMFVQRLLDSIQSKYGVFLDVNKKEEKENLNFFNERLEQEKQSSFDNGFDEGFRIGYLDAIKSTKLCPVCNVKLVESLHHILPRKYGGFTSLKNVIALCDNCHNKIEGQTEKVIQKWFVNKKDTSIETLKMYILKGFPEELEKLEE